MWWDGTPLDLYVGAAETWWCDGQTTLHRAAHENLKASLESVAPKLRAGQSRRPGVRVWLSGRLCRPFLLPAASASLSASEVSAVAREIAPGATGLDGPVRLWMAAPGREIAVALLEQLMTDLGPLHRSGWRVRSIRPLWSAMLNHVLAADPACALVQLVDTETAVTLAGTAERYRHAAVSHLGDTAEAREPVLVRAQIAAAAEGDGSTRQVVLQQSTVAKPLQLPFGHAMEVVQ
ncbi:hypothetical protein V4F39_06950 [Aquincola sp. MAHUQ-54]|uniref:Uncharacterized protein n=1 Tax=Aquincola agrisoli TaxID=3119538 RepID=A0AAW9Q2R5_9BURK